MRFNAQPGSVSAIAAVIVALLLNAAPAEAAPADGQAGGSPAPHLEVTVAWTAAFSIPDGMIEAAFEPVLRQGGTRLESQSTQRLTVDTGVGHGVELGLDAFPRRFAGVHVGISTARADLSGLNSDYRTSIRYVSLQPPDYQPAEHAVAQLLPWDATSGRLRTSALTLAGAVRLAPGRRVGGTLRAGIDLERYSGEIHSLAYTQFVMGGHATLFAVSHHVRMAPVAGQTFVRPHVGGDVHVAIARHVALVGGLRVTLGPSRRIRTEPAGLTDPSENSFAPNVADVKAAMGEPVLDLPGARWRMLLGVKLLGG